MMFADISLLIKFYSQVLEYPKVLIISIFK